MRYEQFVLATTVVAVAACGDRADEKVGTAQFSVRSTGASGAEYELRNAQFDVVGPEPHLVSGNGAAEVINLDISPGAYSATLLAGWSIRRRQNGGSWQNVEATLLHSTVVEFTISAGNVTPVIYRFGIGGEFIEFGKGRAAIGIEIDEGSGGSGGSAGSAGSAGSGGSGACMNGPLTNAVEFPDNLLDDDCDGQIDEPAEVCDQGVALATNDPVEAARALGICQVSGQGNEPGLVSATWVLPDGMAAPSNANYDLGHGVLSGFGSNVAPREGSRLLALSTGTARQPNDPGFQSPQGFNKGYTHGAPTGFPMPMPQCQGLVTGTPHDGVALEVVLRLPSNAGGFSLDSNFYATDSPAFLCTQFNDVFLALMDPAPQQTINGNIAYDSSGNPINVNGSMEVCAPGNLLNPCSQGIAELAGTGFENHAASGWLRSQTPAAPGSQITLRFVIYDSGDGVFDSTVLLDRLVWLPVVP